MQLIKWRTSLSVVVGAALVMAAAGTAVAQAGDPLLGTWKLNVAKSHFKPGPAPKAGSLKYEAAGEGLKVTVDTDGAEGKAHWEYTANFDGKDYPVVGNPDGEAVVLKRLATTKTEAAFKVGGKATTTSTREVSADGKTLTITTKGTNAQGKAIDNVQVFDKQ